jgi:hypothetical protein
MSEEEEIMETEPARTSVARVLIAIVRIVCGVFALILVAHIILVGLDANPNNGFFRVVDDWSGAVSLGFRGLFTPANAKVQVLLNDGLAAIVWLIISAVATYLLSQLGAAGGRRYRVFR